MNKKGFIFTFISVILISVIVLAFLIQYTSRTGANIERTNTEVETMNSFVKSLNNDYLPRALQISGNQAILALLDYMDDEEGLNGYLDDSVLRIINVLYSGKYELGNEQPLELMVVDDINYNLTTTLNEIILLANATGITFDFNDLNVEDINVFQDNPWYVNVSLIISYKISNKKDDILWNYENNPITINTSIPLINFRDPIYFIQPKGNGVSILINKTIYNLPGEIEPHVLYTNYIQCDLSPNFLNRMQGNSDGSVETGIESLVNLKDSGQSAIDFQYLELVEQQPGQLRQIETSDYYIDDSHAFCYNL